MRRLACPLLALSGLAAGQTPAYRLEVIPVPVGLRADSEVTPSRINNPGTVVGNANWYEPAFVSFTRTFEISDGVATVLPPVFPEHIDPHVNRYATGLNERGDVVGWDAGPSSMVWMYKDGVIHRLPSFDGGGVTGIDASGNVGGYLHGHAAAILNGTFTNLPDGGSINSSVEDVGESGVMVGLNEIAPFNFQACWWRDGQFHVLEETQEYDSVAYSVATNGTISGAWGDRVSQTGIFVVHNGVRTLYHNPYGLLDAKSTTGVNSSGVAVGAMVPHDKLKIPLLFQDGTIYEFNKLNLSGAPIVVGGLTDINDSGVIVGYGTMNTGSGDRWTAFRAYPVPEPSMVIALVAGIAAIVRRRMRSPNGFAPVDADLDEDGSITVFDCGLLSDNFDKTGESY